MTGHWIYVVVIVFTTPSDQINVVIREAGDKVHCQMMIDEAAFRLTADGNIIDSMKCKEISEETYVAVTK